MRMEVTESTNSNPSPTVKGRDLLIFQISVFYCMSIQYKYQDIGTANQEKLEKGIQLVLDEKVHQYEDNELRFYVEGEERQRSKPFKRKMYMPRFCLQRHSSKT